MGDTFGQTTSQLGALRSILDSYPFSVASLREQLQNADDAGASKQMFMLDRRTHSTQTLYHQDLSSTQGPALLAFNDAQFTERDWEALQHAYESSKSDDSSKIGKYGVGFRSVFHITDCPQILSGNFLAMFDPLQSFTGSAGFKKNLQFISSTCPDQLAPFEWFEGLLVDDKFHGTVIRCPLRTTGSKIRTRTVNTEDISNLFHDFINEELGISLLFLQNINHLELYDVDEQGVSTCLASLSISRSEAIAQGSRSETYTTTVTTTIGSSSHEKRWSILHCPFDKGRAIQLLSQGFPGDSTAILREHKLLPDVGIAIPLDPTAADRTSGRLFTYLPLPLPTGFCAHVHALFALTQSRQNLRNPREVGVVPGSSDQILIEWNRLLFDHFIPGAWGRLLEVLAHSDSTSDIFSAWPPDQRSPATSGESVYWEFLPENLFKFVTSSKSAVWPVYCPLPLDVEYRPLEELIMAEPTISKEILGALTLMGLRLTRPSAYICRLIKDASDGRFTVLTPEVAHAALLNHLNSLRAASKEHVSVVLQYLLSTQNVLNIVDLPIIPSISGELIALSSKQDASDIRTLMNRQEYDVFGSCDDSAIPLQSLPFQVADALRVHGSKLLNVETLGVPRIVEYLTLYPNRMGLDLYLNKTDARVIKWLSVFWMWMKDYAHRDELLGKVKELYLLPSSHGLRKAEAALFRSRGEHPNYVAALSSLGLPFLDADLTAAAQEVLASFGLLRSISNIHEVLTSLPTPPSSDQGDSKPLARDTCLAALKHIATHAQGSCILRGAFNKEQLQKLKSLPIYPMATFPPGDKPNLVVEHMAIPDDVSLKSIDIPPFLPSIPGIGFTQMSSIAPSILQYLDPSSAVHHSDLDILDLTVRTFTTQPDYLHAAVLSYIVRNRHRIPPYILESLQDAGFVMAKDGVRRKPGDLVDPDSKLASLYGESAERQVKSKTGAEKSILRSLQALRFIQHTLSASLTQDLIELIAVDPSSQKSINLARSLWSLVTIERLDCSTLKIAPEQRCFPTDQGLRGPAECRDPTRTSPHLFDRVLAVLEPLNIPSSLRQVLGWNQPIPIDILIRQLDAVLDTPEDMFETVRDIVKHLSSRHDCSDGDIGRLRKVTASRKWVPTTDGHLAETRNAVFLAPVTESGFHQVMSLDSKMKDFIRQLGCTDKPSYDAIIIKLKELQEQLVSLNTVNTALALLRSLSSNLDDIQRDRLLLPDETGQLRSFSAVYFNDIGEHARLVPLQSNFIAHPLLDDSLAKRLGVTRLGLEYEDVAEPGVDMGEKPVTTVRKTISEYNEKQFATEFLANAADANATEFSLMVNRFHPDSHDEFRALSPIMAEFCTSDTLVVYNNSTFSEADFMGILRTSIGGKRDKPTTIGQFGLGALAMFHFTEMGILVSNNSVLFLNPSKEHLPISGRASLSLALNRVRQYYPRHLASIDGLFGFSISSREPYNGTIFILPLRKASHFEGFSDVVSRREWTASQVESEVLSHFQESAPNCLLFTPIRKLSGHILDAHGNHFISWSSEANRSLVQIETDSGYSVVDVSVVSDAGSGYTWRTAHATIPEGCIPQEILAPLHTHHRPRLPASIGLAAMLEDTSASSNPLFFSTLPLAIPTSLPVHIMASFLLSSDRRHIRLDQKRTPESDFNEWLLSHAIPPLYLFLLQNLLQVGDNKPWWPGQHREAKDTYSHLVIDAFYSKYLMTSTRPLFRNMYNPTISLSPQDVVLSREEPTSVHLVLSVMQSRRIARLSSGPYRLAKDVSGIAVVSPAFLKSEILHGDPSVISEFDSDTVEDVITYLLDHAKDAANLVGLPVLPLEDGSFGTLHARSDSELYFAWTPRKRDLQHNFPPGRFIHPKLKPREILKLQLNVISLDVQAIQEFVEAKLPSSSPFEAPHDVANWIHDFWHSWDEYSHLGLTDNDILQFPLVPTVRPDTFVSLASCKAASSVTIEGASQQTEFICAFLDDLDVHVVRLHEMHLPDPLVHILHADQYPRFNLTTVLKVLEPQQDSIAEAIASMDSGWKSAFADWARDNIHDVIPDQLQPVVLQLPLWPSASNNLPLDVRPASEVHMLPRDIPIDIISRFMDICVAEYGNLRFLRGPCLTLAQVNERLSLPTTLSEADLALYKLLLQAWIPLFPAVYDAPLPVPNCSSVIMPSNELYARDPLFLAAFEEDSPFFIHSDFQTLEQALYKHGLKTENELDMPMFLDCVTALSERSGDDLVARASVLFDAYGISLPMRIAADEEHRWSELNDCPFIPRSMATHRRLQDQHVNSAGLEIPQNITALDQVVAPCDLVRKEYEAIAWTQRAMFSSQPNQRVIVAYPELGRPTISEVVAHLRYLSSLTGLSSTQRRIVLHDLEETYSFLNENASSEAAAQALSQLGASEIFLNVDNPETDDWRWDKVDDLVFDSQDHDETMRHVRSFLMPYGKLLRIAGVVQVSRAQYPSNSWNFIAAPETKLASIRLGFEELRKKRSLIDVIFLAGDHAADSEPLVAHRSFLAVSSEYFSILFCGGFKEDKPASAASPIPIDVPDHSTACVRLVLDHVYTGVEPDASTSMLDLLLEALKLSGFWDIKDLFRLLQKEITNMITPRTLDQIRTAADHSHAEELVQTCIDYEEGNMELIRKYASRHAPSFEPECE